MTPDSRLSIRNSQNGSVLIFVVWAILLLSLFTASLGSRMFFTLGLTERLSEQLSATYLARAAVQYAALELERDGSGAVDGFSDLWSSHPSVFRDHSLADGWFRVTAPEPSGSEPRYGVTDEERYLNLNTVPADILQRFFELAGGMQKGEANQLAAAVEDWRDEDTRQRQDGAEGFYYRSLGNPYDCKDGPFEHVEELLLVRGVTPTIYALLEPHVTVFGSGSLNLNTAGRMALRALGISDAGVEGVLAFRAGEDGREGTADDRLLVSVSALDSDLGAFVPVEDLAQLSKLAGDGVIGVSSTQFRMLIEAGRTGSPNVMRAFCVLDRQGDVKLWMER
jgi:type II secretory pathway component PulK